MECLINDLPVYFEEYGAGKPILCLHGYSLDIRSTMGCFEPFFQNKQGYRRIYLDMPGKGKTPARDWVKNADIMLDILKQFAHKVIGNEGFLLTGHSYGGYMALGMAQDTNLTIDGIFLLCPVVITDFKERNLPKATKVIEEKGLRDIICSDDLKDFEDFLNGTTLANKETWHRYKNEILSGLKVADKNFTAEYRKNGYGFSFETELNKLQYANPITVLTGRQDGVTGYEDPWNTLKYLPRLTFAALDGAGHMPQIEKTEAFNFYLKNWLEACTHA